MRQRWSAPTLEHVASVRKIYKQNRHGAAESKLVVWTLFLLINGFWGQYFPGMTVLDFL